MKTKPRINWVGPLPPERTDIGHYTARILSALAERFEVTLWHDQEHWDPALESHARIRRLASAAPDWHALNDAVVTFILMGNNAVYHSSCLCLARKLPAVLVMHDLRLHHLVHGSLGYDSYLEAMSSSYGAAGRRAARQLTLGRETLDTLSGAFPFTHYPLSGTWGGPLAVLTHGAGLAQEIYEEYDPALSPEQRPPLFSLPLPFKAGAAPRATSSRDANAPRELLLFGYLGPNRRVETILRVLAGLPEKRRFRLSIYGRIPDPQRLEAEIRRRGLDEIVEFKGFASEKSLDRAVAECDLAFNLRWPSMGEASGTQLRIWRGAAGSLVTRSGWYAELPEDTVFFVEPESEEEGIRGHLLSLLADPSPFHATGKAGRKHLLEHHTPEAYVDGLVGIVEQLPRLWRRQALCGLADAARVGLEAAPEPLRNGPTRSMLADRLAEMAE